MRDRPARAARSEPYPRKTALAGFAILALVTVTQFICRAAISRDEMENIRWGQALAWGSEKHPPLFGWIHYGWVELFGRADLSTYLLQKTNLAVGLLLLYLLVRRLLGRERALLSAVLTLATANAMFISLKYNATSALWPIWAGYLICLYRAWEDRGLGWWLATGLMGGLAVLTKYHSLVLVACSFGWLVSGADGRRLLATWRPWSGVLLGLAVVSPHLAWVWQHGGTTLSYAVDNVTEGRRLARHLLEPARYAAIQALCLLPALGLLIPWIRRDRDIARVTDQERTRFLLWHGPVLGLAPAALSLAGGISLGSLWGMGTWGLAPAWAIARFRLDAGPGRIRAGLVAATGLAMLVATLYFVNTAFLAEQRDYKGATRAVLAAWADRYQGPLTVVGGDGRYYEGLGVYAPGRPDVFGRLDPAFHPRVDPERMSRDGAVIVIPEAGEEALRRAHDRFPIDETTVLDLPARREGIRRTRAERLVVMFMAPRGEASGNDGTAVPERPDVGAGTGDGGP